jgi:hypothetical protein
MERIEKRKHIEQMNRKEILYLYDKLQTIHSLEKGYHARTRADERKVNTESFTDNIKENLKQSRIIEFKEIKYENGEKEQRVLIGTRNNHKKDIDFKVVISLTFNKIITIWENRITDNHKSVDKSIYNKNLRIC